MANEAWRGRGRLHVRCETCTSTGTVYAETVTAGEGETLPICPWCAAPMGVVVKPLPEDLTSPDWS
jgi:hypothetical protein